MVEAETAAPIAPPARKWVLMFVGLAGGVMSLTLLFLAMRAVMEVGGSCASGNTPYAITRPCPEGVPGVMVGSIFGGLLCLGLYAFTAIGVNLVALAWPALFLSLGWNFLVYGIDPPLGDSPAWGWLVCAVVFVLMGGVPLVIAISAFRDGRASRWRAVAATRRVGGRFGPVDEERARHVVRVSLAVQLAAVVVGVWIGIRLFEWATDTSVGFGFR